MPIDSGDTAFMLASTALVMLMTIGLAFFYGGFVRRKNVLAIMMQSFAAFGIVTVVWILVGYSFAFGEDQGGFIGSLQYAGLTNVGGEPHPRYGTTIPALVFMAFQLMFAIISWNAMKDRKSTRLNSSHGYISYAVFCLKKKI